MPENVWRQNQIPFSFLKSEKKPFFLSLDENEKLCCWGSQQTLVSTFRNEEEDARTNGAFRFLLRFKRQNTSNFLFCRRRRQPFFNVRLCVTKMSKFWWLTKTISLFKLEQVWRKCQIGKWYLGSTHTYYISYTYCHFVAARPDYSLVFEDFANLFLLLLMLLRTSSSKRKEIVFEVSKKLQRQMSVRSLTHIISYQLSCKKEE